MYIINHRLYHQSLLEGTKSKVMSKVVDTTRKEKGVNNNFSVLNLCISQNDRPVCICLSTKKD